MAKKKSVKKVDAVKETQADKDQIEEINLEEQVKNEKDKFLRLFAEFENYKRRTAKERIELFSTASEEVMISLLPVLDDFDRASVEIEKDKENEILKGILLIKNKLFDSLKSKGLSLVTVNKGEDFNADNHEAVTQIPAPSKDMQGKIIDVIEKGYKLGDKVIRYPKVIIGK
jgi:molecular chaperone GrpE|tara:strand:- start:524 stop:1039 length:516 start_codon:yes stop_codon:yes gene_type:complete